MAGQSKYDPHTSVYGTTSLESDVNLGGRRRSLTKWGIATLSAGVILAVVGFIHFENISKPSTTAPEPVAMKTSGKDTISAWQSSYINGEKKMMESISGLKWKESSSSSSSFIKVDASKKYQEILGFGGAFTESAALQFHKLSKDQQEEILNLYFDKEKGNGYEFGRVPMGSCDFSVNSYNFDTVANDSTMSHFDTSVEHDTKMIIPFIQRALEKNPKLKMFLAPWSPPAWMKRPDPAKEYVPSMLGSATPNGLDPKFQEAWAMYFSKFITAYKQYGINFWGLTPQNEPEFVAPWEACAYEADFQAEFVGNYLGPIIRDAHPDVKIMVFDHNRGGVWQWAQALLNHPKAKQYVDGTAFHWYDGERYMDGVEFHERLNDTHYVDESRFILATESCNCPGVAQGKDAWFRGQRYAHDIIADFNNWVVGWVDWNLILDYTGGPNHLGNNCDAPIIVDETDKNYFIQPMYYFIQHFSKYIPTGSRRIYADVSVTFKKPGDAQLFPGYPSALHSCDSSSRQAIHVTDDSKLQITGTEYCIDMYPQQYQGQQVVLAKCIYTSQKWTFENDQIRMGDWCLALNHGSTENGVRVNSDMCADVDTQRWRIHNGTLKSFASPNCVTAGYSFVQSAAFITPENKKVLVVLNENTEDAEFEIDFEGRKLETTIPPGAIQTYLWE